VASLVGYRDLEQKFEAKGFKHDLRANAPICRWTKNDLIVDLMTTDRLLGFENIWYESAFTHAILYSLPSQNQIRLICAPHFIATKLEAFHGRGNKDYMASHDLEDIISVVDARAGLIAECQQMGISLSSYLANQFGRLLNAREFVNSLPGHLPGDWASQQRLPMLIQKLQQLAAL